MHEHDVSLRERDVCRSQQREGIATWGSTSSLGLARHALTADRTHLVDPKHAKWIRGCRRLVVCEGLGREHEPKPVSIGAAERPEPSAHDARIGWRIRLYHVSTGHFLPVRHRRARRAFFRRFLRSFSADHLPKHERDVRLRPERGRLLSRGRSTGCPGFETREVGPYYTCGVETHSNPLII